MTTLSLPVFPNKLELGSQFTWINEHKRLVLALALTTPIAYYGVNLWLWIRSMKPMWKHMAENFPGPKPHWLLGSLKEHPGPKKEGLDYHINFIKKYIYCYVIWMGAHNPVLEVVHPETAKIVLKSSAPKPRGFSGAYRLIEPWIGEGLLVSDGPKWFRSRRMLTPAFHFDVLKPYMDVNNTSAHKFIEKMKSTEGKSVEVFDPVSLLTLEVILRCAFSFEEDIQGMGNEHSFVNSTRRLSSILVQRVFQPWLLFDKLFNLMSIGREFNRHCAFAHQVADDVIQKRKKALQDDPEVVMRKKCKDFLDILLLARDEQGLGLTDLEIRDEVDTFLFEGHDTTASAISWILNTFATHPEIQEKAHAEIVDRLGDRTSFEWSDLNELPYFTKCIKEALRLNSPVPFIGRTSVEPIELNGRTIPAGVNIDIIIYGIHHNEHVWGKDHDEFKPERFDHENIKDMDSFAFIPFSAGPRNCIGQNFAMHEIKVAVALVLKEFVVEPDPDRPARHVPDVVMRAEGGLFLKFLPRG